MIFSGRKINSTLFLFSITVLLFFPFVSFGHTIPYEFEIMSKTDVGFAYLKMGFKHIIPLGFDHILFILGIFLLKPDLKTVIWQATAFTVAHSITLGLAIYGVIR